MRKIVIDDVAAAFELVIEALANAAEEINLQGADAFRGGRHDHVKALTAKAMLVGKFTKDVSTSQDKWLQEVTPEAPAEFGEKPKPNGTRRDELRISMKYNGALAKGIFNNSSVTVLKGSTIRQQILDSLSDKLAEIRRGYESDGTLVPTEESELLKLSRDIPFKSPSASAQFVAGCSVSGNRDWVLESTQQKLGEYLGLNSASST